MSVWQKLAIQSESLAVCGGLGKGNNVRPCCVHAFETIVILSVHIHIPDVPNRINRTDFRGFI